MVIVVVGIVGFGQTVEWIVFVVDAYLLQSWLMQASLNFDLFDC